MADAVPPAFTNSGGHLSPRRIRHITGVQIRNLTPFPFRDAFTSALSQPVEQSYYGTSGVVDDLAAVHSKRRSQKLSTNSTASHRGLKWEDGAHEHRDFVGSSIPRDRAASTSMSKGNASNSPNVGQSFSSSRSTQPLRAHRARTNSMTSSTNNYFTSSATSGPSSSLSIPPLFPDNSQAFLEKVIGPRMVETYIIVSLPRSQPLVTLHSPHVPSPSLQRANGLKSAPIQIQNIRLTSGTRKLALDFSSTSDPSRLPSNRMRAPALDPVTSSNTKAKEASRAHKHDVKPKVYPTPGPNGSISASKSSSQRKGKPILTHPETENFPEYDSDIHTYFSPIHRPSTNPSFSIDALSSRDFLQWTDTSGDRLNIEVWGRITDMDKQDESTLKRKWQHQTKNATDRSQHGWKLLDNWDINLSDLAPLPKDLDINPSHLPSNTILITLSPPGGTFYLPPSTPISPRSSTPSVGYTSDPESEIRKAKQVDQYSWDTSVQSSLLLPLSKRRRHHATGTSVDSEDGVKSAGWGELFKLVTLQSCILDNEASQTEIVRKINGLLKNDMVFSFRREINEREARIRELTANHSTVISQSAKKRKELLDRTQSLQSRARLLDSARLALEFNIEIELQSEEERNQLTILRQRLRLIRSNLLSILCTIFPIELLSPPDLLFTILDIPLPIPITANDPAPPLTIPEHKEVTEEAVATALGYVAQTIQILAAYTGQALVYPVTCIGSRSLIRDGISSMVGPRMFPLFSRGVETYRFEYGVFLLNKDLEMLMSEWDLRALDIRHTLPNLKNLLLTLSHDSSQIYQPTCRTYSPVTSTPGLETPEVVESFPIEDDVQTPKASRTPINHPAPGGMTPIASGATTPTTAALSEESRKAKSFLGFVPFTDFLRVRYPSTSQSSDKTLSESHYAAGAARVEDFEGDTKNNGSETETDRMTLRANKGSEYYSSVDSVEGPEG